MSQASEHILTVAESARLLKVHPNTVRNLIKAGTIRAAWVGRQGRCVEAELVAWIRSGYPDAARTQPGASRKEAIWHSGNVHRNTMSSSQHRTERELDALLERPTGGRPRNITTG